MSRGFFSSVFDLAISEKKKLIRDDNIGPVIQLSTSVTCDIIAKKIMWKVLSLTVFIFNIFFSTSNCSCENVFFINSDF